MTLSKFTLPLLLIGIGFSIFFNPTSLAIQAFYDEEIFLFNESSDSANDYRDYQWGINRAEKFSINPSFSLPRISNDNNNISIIKVAVIDGLVDYNHPDLKDSIMKNDDGSIQGYNFVEDRALDQNQLIDPNLDPAASHGTHVAGIIAANSNNNFGVNGICNHCRILPLKVFGGENGGGSIGNALDALDFAINKNVDIINISWGGRTENPLLKDKINQALSRGIIVVAASGNNSSNDTISYPANLDGVISVAATRRDTGEKTEKSNISNRLTTYAPGENIPSTVLKSATKTCPDNNFSRSDDGYGLCSGTSMAAPAITGSIGQFIKKFGRDDLKNRVIGRFQNMENKKFRIEKLLE
jgi:subtilisin family serine protease